MIFYSLPCIFLPFLDVKMAGRGGTKAIHPHHTKKGMKLVRSVKHFSILGSYKKVKFLKNIYIIVLI